MDNEYRKLYYEAHKEELKEKSRKYYRDNKKRVKERRKVYYQANKERLMAYSKAYYRAHKVNLDESDKKLRLEYTKWLLNQVLNKNKKNVETITEHQ